MREHGNKLPVPGLARLGLCIFGDRMADRAADEDENDPVTLHRIMQTMIGDGLRARYRPPRKLPHEIFVLLLQLKEEERRRKGRGSKRTVAASRALSASG